MEPECWSGNDQYFVEDIVKFNDGEVFVDGGGFIGDTAQVFIDMAKKAKVKFKKIIIFEPDQTNCDLIRKHFRRRDDVVVVQKGLSDREETLLFAGEGGGVMVVKDAAENAFSVPVIDLDSVPECQDATWIKMDIEGSEMDALKGAREVILRNHPKLTICIYHSNEDMLCIAEYIHELVPEYKLYVRCHKWDGTEAVLYAIP